MRSRPFVAAGLPAGLARGLAKGLAGGLAALLGSAAARADEPVPTTPLEVSVKGTRRPDAGTVLATVPAERIERLGTTSVATTLERMPSITSGGGMRGERILNLRGFDQRQIAVFVDGVPVYVPYDGQLDLDKVPVDMVARVAVVKGAASLLYGPNGLGGAIHIVTRAPAEGLSLRTFTEASPLSAARSSMTASGRAGPVGALVHASFEGVRFVPMSESFAPAPNEDGGRRDNSDRLAGNLTGKVLWDVDERHRIALAASHFEGRFGVPPAVHDFTVRDWRWTDWYSSSLGLSHTFQSPALQTEEVVYVAKLGNTLDAYDDGRYATQLKPKAFHSIYDEGAAGGFVRTTATLPVGAERTFVLRTWTGAKHDMHAGQADRDADTVRASTNLLTTAAQGELDVVPGWLLGSAGLELDGELPDAPSSGLAPRPALGWGPMGSVTFTPAQAWTITAGVASRTRFPTLRERFSTVFGTRDPNPLLRPERAVNLSLDVVFKPSRSLRVAAGLFDSELTDLITSVFVAPGVDQMQNAARARYLGAEAEIGWTFAPWLDVLAGWMILHARGGDALAQPLAYRPEHKGLVLATVTPLAGLSLTGVMRYVGRQEFQNPDTGQWGHLGGFPMFDARLAYAFSPALRAWVRVTNLADADVEPRYSFPEAGRQVFVGIGSSTGS
ncbi:MAG: TonB-dependent receptor [Polyangiaceae bacterium]